MNLDVCTPSSKWWCHAEALWICTNHIWHIRREAGRSLYILIEPNWKRNRANWNCEVLTIIVLYGLPISWRNFIDLSKGRQRAFMSLSIEVWVIRVRSMYLIGTRRSTLAVICDPNSSLGVCANVVLLELCTLSQDSF